MVTVRPCSISAASAMVATNVASAGRRGERQDGEVRRQHAGQAEGQRHQRQQQRSGQAQPGCQQHGHHAAQHDQVAVREVHRTGGVEREHEAERHQRIGHAQRQRVQDELEGDQRGGLVFSGRVLAQDALQGAPVHVEPPRRL
jgi:hypothetical protein